MYELSTCKVPIFDIKHMHKDEHTNRSELRSQKILMLLLQLQASIEVPMKGPEILKCLLHLFFLLVLISFHVSSAIDTISISEPVQDPGTIVSSGQTFKLGFFSPENTSSRYVGIMYNVPELSVVWVANREKPLNDSSGVLAISEDGNLVVLNGKKEILWSSNAPNPAPNSTALLLENGNLVLRDSSNERRVWESFQHPTNSFLEGMRIGGSGNGTIQLTSWRSPSDPSSGSFSLVINPLRIPELFVWNGGVLYWRSGPWNGNIFMGVSGMGALYQNRYYLARDDAGTAYFTYTFVNATMLLHYELSSSGDFQEKFLNENGDWEVSYSCLKSECDIYGKCGPNGRCDPKSSPICSCLEGFEPRDKEEWTKGNWSGGCSRKALLQCQRNSSAGREGEKDGFLKFTGVKVPDLSNFIEAFEVDCGNECLKNCSCSAYIYVVGIGCLYWVDDLIDIQQFSITGSDLYLRVAHSELDPATSNKRAKAIIAATVTVGCSLLAILSYFLWIWFNRHRVYKKEAELSLIEGMEAFNTEMMQGENLGKSKLKELPLYRYMTLANATDHFHHSNKLGQGGFGPVYKGKLVNGQAIAVKRLSNSSSQGVKEFMNEVTVISRLQHRNLVKLLGCCVERAEKMLVYEYMPNKSLDAYLFDSQKQDLLDWNRRYSIIEGISRGLLYLHRDSRLRIIHRDLKASNILLDEELNPKISDFGLARIFGGKQDQANTNRVVGTYGYMAPEYAMGGKFSVKSDVYSFGVLLLEIVSGKRNTSFHLVEENLSLLGYAWKLWNENEALKLAFKENLDTCMEIEIQRCIQVGLLCVQESAVDRPNMSNVLSMLNNEIGELSQPKLPAYTARLSLFQDQCSPQREDSVNDVSLTDVQGR